MNAMPVQRPLHESTGQKLHETRVAHEGWKIRPQMGSNVLGVIMFERPVVAPMKVNENRHDFAEGECWLAAVATLARLEQVPVIERFKPLAEVINIAEHSGELQLAHRDPLLLRWIRG